MRRHPRAALFPYTTLFRSDGGEEHQRVVFAVLFAFDIEKASRDSDCERRRNEKDRFEEQGKAVDADHAVEAVDRQDRKSTRLNPSHLVISYAVFCLKKKTP